MTVTGGPVISVRDLDTRFGDVWVHRGLNLEISKGEMVSLVLMEYKRHFQQVLHHH